MARKKVTKPKRQINPKGKIELQPARTRRGLPVLIHGFGWEVVPLALYIGRAPVRPQRILLGSPVEAGFRPSPQGEFLVEVTTGHLAPSRHRVRVVAICEPGIGLSSQTLELEPGAARVPPEKKETDDERRRREVKQDGGGGPFLRQLDWFRRRFGHLGYIPEGVRITQLESIRDLRTRRDRDIFSPGPVPEQPQPGVCNWTPVGPGPVIVSPTSAFAGRVISIAFDPSNANIIYIGAANGGVWKSTNRGVTWSPKSDYQNSLAIGALAIDPNNNQRVFAGTGQYGGAVGTFYGNGILYSSNGGTSWSELATATFQRDEISQILFDPTDATSQRMFLSSRQGVWQTTDAGANWSLLRAGAASDLVLIVSGGNVQLIAGFAGSGIFTATRTGTTWGTWTQYTSTNFPPIFDRIVLGQSRNNPTHIYAAFSDGYNIAGIAKTPDGGTTWNRITPPVVVDLSVESSDAGAPVHKHTVTLTGAAMTAGTLTYTTGGPTAGAAHTHTITLTAAQLSDLRNGIATVTVTSSVASGHSHTFTLNRRTSGQTWYNFHISPHSTNPDIVYYGEVSLWKTSTGNGPWTQLPILHTDNHAFAYAPDDANQVWSVGDGGVYMSPDAGATFQHRNRDLQVLEYISLAQHPQWETIMIGGTQDNGTQRFTGNPAWEFIDGGDGGFTAIDPSNPSRMYHEYVRQHYYRSDSHGAPGTWAYKPAGSPGSVEFYAPFVLDPSNSNTCYFGADELWRSANNADSWDAITSTINGNITAIAVHPTNSNIIYVGTTGGRVYQVQKTGATWALADVTTTEITGTGLPASVYISDLVVDSAGNIWVTLSSVLWSETSGEFTNDHVYRRASGGTNWVSRSTGLAQANPINSIVIDPSDSNRLFCGGDVGVFRTENAGMNWVPWDEGLPNVAVFDLQIQGPRRLLRAATHGRSIWERPIDSSICPLVDLYMRDNILDSGRVQPTPAAVHPFDASLWAGHWQSEDIKVDAPEPNFQTTNIVDNYVGFATLQNRSARRNRTNRFYVQVHNRGVNVAHNVQVRAFFAPTSPGLPPLPSDFWTGGRPFSGTPSGPNWTPIGATINLGDLEPGEPGIAEWDWLIPNSAPRHSCVLAIATCAEDPITGVGTLNPDELVLNSKHVTLKNLVVENAVAGTAMPPDQPMTAELHASSPDEKIAELRIQWGTLPRRTRLFLVFSRGAENEPVLTASPEQLKRLGIEVSNKYTKLFPASTRDAYGCLVKFDRTRILAVQSPKGKLISIPGIRLHYGTPVQMGMNLILPRDARGVYQFDVVRLSGEKITGGVTYRVEVESE